MLKRLTVLVMTTTLFGCDDDETSKASNQGISFPLTINTTAVDTNYFVSSLDLLNQEAVISTQGQGIEISGYSYFYTVANTTFSIKSDGSVTAYTGGEDGLEELNVANTDTYTWGTFGNVNNEKMLAIDGNWGNLVNYKLHTFDAATGLSEGAVSLQILDNNDNGAAWPTALVVRDNQLYIPYIKLYYTDAVYTPDADKGYVAVFNYPVSEGATPVKTISTSDYSNLGTHGSNTGLVLTDTGDMYGYTNGEISAGFNPASSKPSSIVRIKDGETEFDSTYDFNIEEVTSGGKIFWMQYLSGTKVIARIVERINTLVDHDQDGGEVTPEIPLGDALDNVAWEDYYNASGQAYRQKLAIIDLAQKEITEVTNVPSHQMRLVPDTEVIDGQFYVTVTTAEGISIYGIDVETGVGVKGATVDGYIPRGFQNLYD